MLFLCPFQSLSSLRKFCCLNQTKSSDRRNCKTAMRSIIWIWNTKLVFVIYAYVLYTSQLKHFSLQSFRVLIMQLHKRFFLFQFSPLHHLKWFKRKADEKKQIKIHKYRFRITNVHLIVTRWLLMIEMCGGNCICLHTIPHATHFAVVLYRSYKGMKKKTSTSI